MSLQRRGGIHRSHGVFQGGGPLDDDYRSKAKYKFSTQLRNTKSLEKMEANLYNALKDLQIPKFNGNLEKTATTTSTKTELDKEEFLDEVQELVMRYGLETFFYTPSPDGTMVFLAKDPHMLELNDVITEHTNRLENEPSAVLDSSSSPKELQTSIDARHKFYDEFETDDILLSRLVVDSIISPDLRSKVKTRFGHTTSYSDLPGQVYLMMVLEVCNASFTYDIHGAVAALDDLSLSFPWRECL